MTDLQTAAQQALEAPGCERLREWASIGPVQRAAVEGFLEAALAQQERDTAVHMTHCNQGEWLGVCKYGEEDCPALAQQEPVVWTATRLWNRKELWTCPADIARDLLEGYTHPPRREWQGLTEEEINALWASHDKTGEQITRAIEAALKERNT
jgi:hypothetical protein